MQGSVEFNEAQDGSDFAFLGGSGFHGNYSLASGAIFYLCRSVIPLPVFHQTRHAPAESCGWIAPNVCVE